MIDSHFASAPQLAADCLVEEARQQWQLCLTLRPGDSSVQLRVATAMHEFQLLDEAIALYRVAPNVLTDSSALRNNLGVAMRAKGLQSEALEEFKKAYALAPNDVAVLTNLANAHNALRQFDDAIAVYRRALAVRPHLPAHVNLGSLLQSMGQFYLAEVEYIAALKIDPLFAMAESNLLF